jgi:hypothetical protein
LADLRPPNIIDINLNLSTISIYPIRGESDYRGVRVFEIWAFLNIGVFEIWAFLNIGVFEI